MQAASLPSTGAQRPETGTALPLPGTQQAPSSHLPPAHERWAVLFPQMRGPGQVLRSPAWASTGPPRSWGHAPPLPRSGFHPPPSGRCQAQRGSSNLDNYSRYYCFLSLNGGPNYSDTVTSHSPGLRGPMRLGEQTRGREEGTCEGRVSGVGEGEQTWGRGRDWRDGHGGGGETGRVDMGEGRGDSQGYGEWLWGAEGLGYWPGRGRNSPSTGDYPV